MRPRLAILLLLLGLNCVVLPNAFLTMKLSLLVAANGIVFMEKYRDTSGEIAYFLCAMIVNFLYVYIAVVAGARMLT